MTTDCPCLESPQPHNHYHHVHYIGTDETNGRYGEVELWQCKQCQRYWLHYAVTYEHLTASGRYFMGLIMLEQAEALWPDQAVSFLENLGWYLFGGSYFDGKRGRSANHPDQRLPVD
jgi:hypothetical protein